MRKVEIINNIFSQLLSVEYHKYDNFDAPISIMQFPQYENSNNQNHYSHPSSTVTFRNKNNFEACYFDPYYSHIDSRKDVMVCLTKQPTHVGAKATSC